MIAAQPAKKSPGHREAAGALYQYYYLDVAGAVEDFLWLLLLPLLLLPLFVLLVFAAGAGVAVAVSAAVGAADFGASAAIEAAARPKLNKAVVIRVADLFMRTPNGGI
jgi:hypothetical protein